MKKKATSWAYKILTGHLPAQYAWEYLSLIINKKLDYPLLALSLSNNECGELIAIIKDSGLPHSSIWKKSPLNFVHGTSDYIGIGMDDLYIIQGSYKIEIVHEFLSRSDMTGNLLRSEIEWSTIHVGIGRGIFYLDYDLYVNILSRSWIKNLWNFAHEYGIYLPTSPSQLYLNREGDLFIMEKFYHSGFPLIQ